MCYMACPPPHPPKKVLHRKVSCSVRCSLVANLVHWSPCVDIKLVSFHSLLEEVELSHTDIDACKLRIVSFHQI